MIYSKYINKTLCTGLTAKEYRCKCGYKECRAFIAPLELLKAVERFRLYVDLPLYFTSGYRCPRHNFKEGGKALSYHQLGAVDIKAENLLECYEPKRIKFLMKESGFTFVLYNAKKGYFHGDCRGV